MATPTQYVVWDSVNARIVAGPFPNSADATTAMRRAKTKSEGRKGLSHEPARPWTVETLNG